MLYSTILNATDAMSSTDYQDNYEMIANIYPYTRLPPPSAFHDFLEAILKAKQFNIFAINQAQATNCFSFFLVMIDLDFFFKVSERKSRIIIWYFYVKKEKRKMIKKREEEDFLFVRKFGKF